MKWCYIAGLSICVAGLLLESVGVIHAQSPKVETPVLDVLPLPEPSTPRWTIEDDVRQLRAQLTMQASLNRKLSLLIEDLLQRVETLEKSQVPRQVRKSDQSPVVRGRRRQSVESNAETVSP